MKTYPSVCGSVCVCPPQKSRADGSGYSRSVAALGHVQDPHILGNTCTSRDTSPKTMQYYRAPGVSELLAGRCVCVQVFLLRKSLSVETLRAYFRRLVSSDCGSLQHRDLREASLSAKVRAAGERGCCRPGTRRSERVRAGCTLPVDAMLEVTSRNNNRYVAGAFFC